MNDLFGQVVDHRCLACGKVHQGARDVTLATGVTASSYSEDWRHECEARAILQVPGLHARQNMLTKIERKRGKDVADALRGTMTVLWQLAQPAGK